MTVEPSARITVQQILLHPWLRDSNMRETINSLISPENDENVQSSNIRKRSEVFTPPECVKRARLNAWKEVYARIDYYRRHFEYVFPLKGIVQKKYLVFSQRISGASLFCDILDCYQLTHKIISIQIIYIKKFFVMDIYVYTRISKHLSSTFARISHRKSQVSVSIRYISL